MVAIHDHKVAMGAIHDHKVAMGAVGDHGPPWVASSSHSSTPSLHPRPGRHLHPPPLPPHRRPGGSGRRPRLLHQVGATTSWGDTWGHFGDNPAAPVSPPRRRRIQQAQLMKGPNKIILTMEDLTFINTQSSKRVRDTRGHISVVATVAQGDLVAPGVAGKVTLWLRVQPVVGFGLRKRTWAGETSWVMCPHG